MTLLATAAKQALRLAPVRRAAMTAAAARGKGLVLVFHRVDPVTGPAMLVPSVSESILRSQIQSLLEVGEVVDLEDMLGAPQNWRRPRFVVTFDDDYPTHYLHALPILQSLDITATFFLSGRALHGLGPLWFEKLDALIRARGVREAARQLDVQTDDDLGRLARMCEAEPRLQERIHALPDEQVVRHLTATEIRSLADAGMTIGFHTLEHQLLTILSDSAIRDALTRGRRALEDAAGRPVRVFAYPHGKADSRAAARVAEAGFVAACTGEPIATRPGEDPHRIGRWEPGCRPPNQFVASLAARLNMWRRM
jgi:peptidoglycan/xylan/chitin deacetylase (PgdA/CDA1 family)